MIAELERLTRDYFDIEEGQDNPHSHLDYVVAMVESGEPISAIASRLEEPVRRQMLSDYLHGAFPEAEDRLASSRAIMGEAMAEDALVIIDEAVADKTDVARNTARARMRESLARMFNPELNPNKQQSGVTLNVGALHLASLTMPMDQIRALSSSTAPHARAFDRAPEGQIGVLMAPGSTAITGATDNVNSTQAQ